MSTSETWIKVRRRLVGVVFLLLLSLLVWLSIAAYDKRFTSVSLVALHTTSAGNEMHPHADVKLRGVVVGEVRQITADGSGALLKLALQPDRVRLLPANVSAQLLPTTLFGERFVALIPPAQPSAQRLTDGSAISQDRSQNAIELEQVLDNVLPLLTAVQPAKLSATLTAIAQALEGRGEQLGRTLVELDAYLAQLNPYLPTLNRNIQELVRVVQTYDVAAPDIVQAMTDFTVGSRTIVDQRANLDALYSTVTGSTRNLEQFLRENKGNIIRLSADGRPAVELLARYAPSFPCTLRLLADFVPAADAALGKGTGEPGLHVDVTVVPSLGKYLPDRDRPVYAASGGPQCYSLPFLGPQSGRDPDQAAVAAVSSLATAQGGLGLPNSPQENQLVNELLAPALGTVPPALPDWSSVLVGPVFRGADVRIK